MQIFLAEPFISQDSEKLRFQVEKSPVDECLQQISRILCPAPSPLETSSYLLQHIQMQLAPRMLATAFVSLEGCACSVESSPLNA
jgi:hypothetical protein